MHIRSTCIYLLSWFISFLMIYLNFKSVVQKHKSLLLVLIIVGFRFIEINVCTSLTLFFDLSQTLPVVRREKYTRLTWNLPDKFHLIMYLSLLSLPWWWEMRIQACLYFAGSTLSQCTNLLFYFFELLDYPIWHN